MKLLLFDFCYRTIPRTCKSKLVKLILNDYCYDSDNMLYQQRIQINLRGNAEG